MSKITQKGKRSRAVQVTEPEPELDMQEEEEFDVKQMSDMEDDLDDIDMDDMDELPLFWSMKLVAGQEEMVEEPILPGYMIHITHACFGPKINKDTRTLVMLETAEQDEAVPICVLSERNENVQLDLMINDAAMLRLDGQNVSEVYLTGYLMPEFEDDEMDGCGHDHDDEIPENYFDEDEDIQEIDDEEEEEEEEEDLDEDEQ